jgi:hypothetical protein
MDRLKNLRKFLIDGGYSGTQTFDCGNIVGDPMHVIYDEDEITVYYCYHYDYLEIFGLSDEEYASLGDILDIC